jgi:hypothetical protein
MIEKNHHNINNKKNLWLPMPTQLLIQGQWWSILMMQRWHALQW